MPPSCPISKALMSNQRISAGETEQGVVPVQHTEYYPAEVVRLQGAQQNPLPLIAVKQSEEGWEPNRTSTMYKVGGSFSSEGKLEIDGSALPHDKDKTRRWAQESESNPLGDRDGYQTGLMG